MTGSHCKALMSHLRAPLQGCLPAALGAAGCLCLAGGALAQQPAAPPVLPAVAGLWLDDSGDGIVEILPCGDRLCGRIVWLKAPTDKAGRPLTDGYNPDARKRGQPICGLQVLGDLKRVGGNTWDAGWIYDPKDGKSYDVEIKPRGPDRLQVTGYLGVKFLSESFIWTRAPDTTPRCVTAAG